MTRMERRRIQMAERKQEKKARLKAQAGLRRKQAIEGLSGTRRITADNAKSEYKTYSEEIDARQETAKDYLKVLQRGLPGLLIRLSRVDDYRNPKKIKHKVAVILLLAIFWFVFQKSSRREANEELTNPVFLENMRLFFPDLESLPHHDTVNRFLCMIDINQLQGILVGLIKDFIRSKKFQNYLIDKCVPMAIDGTQKHTYDFLWSEECLERTRNEKTQYYCYTLEASLVFQNGIIVPVITEFLDFMQGDELRNKQDCEVKAFKRLAEKIKTYFPRLKVIVLIDGIYANGPVIEICRRYGWQFMIVLKDDSLPSVWEEFNALKNFDDNRNNRHTHKWGNRRQRFIWVNDICYMYEQMRKEETVHVVVCEEEWEEVGENAQIITQHKKFAWISSEPLNRWNLHQRCNLGGRSRWVIENGGFLVEKRHGYQYEHAFSFNWNAMKGFHVLMRIGHLINVLAQYSNLLRSLCIKKGLRAFIKFMDETFRSVRLNLEWIRKALEENYQVRYF
jgi:hypothetical protein